MLKISHHYFVKYVVKDLTKEYRHFQAPREGPSFGGRGVRDEFRGSEDWGKQIFFRIRFDMNLSLAT